MNVNSWLCWPDSQAWTSGGSATLAATQMSVMIARIRTIREDRRGPGT
jgi:hypothetical protein